MSSTSCLCSRQAHAQILRRRDRRAKRGRSGVTNRRRRRWIRRGASWDFQFAWDHRDGSTCFASPSRVNPRTSCDYNYFFIILSSSKFPRQISFFFRESNYRRTGAFSHFRSIISVRRPFFSPLSTSLSRLVGRIVAELTPKKKNADGLIARRRPLLSARRPLPRRSSSCSIFFSKV